MRNAPPAPDIGAACTPAQTAGDAPSIFLTASWPDGPPPSVVFTLRLPIAGQPADPLLGNEEAESPIDVVALTDEFR